MCVYVCVFISHPVGSLYMYVIIDRKKERRREGRKDERKKAVERGIYFKELAHTIEGLASSKISRTGCQAVNSDRS